VTERQLQYLAEAGFKSILSTQPQPEPLDSFNNITGPFPSSQQEIDIAARLGMTGVVLDTKYSPESAQQVSDAILTLEKPVYVHCGMGYVATLFTELHLFHSAVTPSEELFPDSLTLGWDFQTNADAVSLVNDVTLLDPPAAVTAPAINLLLAEGGASYSSYYWSHRVGSDSWYNTGQVLESHVVAIAQAGYRTVISFRGDGESTGRLASDPQQGAVDNGEFSDASGNYNVTAEQLAFEAQGVHFVSLPVSGEQAWTAQLLEEYSPEMAAAAKRGPVLAHCATGYR
jgi:protein tyrosine phosphatase (PTP) superfamily phosphohydrolase (DUF442 family)